MNLNNISLDQIIIIMIVILVFIIFSLIVLGNIRKVKKSVRETSESSRNTREKINELDQHVKKLSDDNKEVIKVHKQIKDKSEAMNKMLKQTNRIYKEVLDRKNEVESKDGEFVKIDYEKINSPEPSQQHAGEHLTQLIKNINSDKESISNKITPRAEVVQRKSSFDSLTKIDIDNIRLMNKQEIEELFLTLKDYKTILNKEVDYYLEQIEYINSNRNMISAQQRLKKKEYIYNEIKEVEKKINYQQSLINETRKRKEELELEQKSYEKEKELDLLINDIAKRK